MRYDLEVYRLTKSKDLYGSEIESYSKVMSLKAGIKQNTGASLINNDEKFHSNLIVFEIYNRNILLTDRIKFDGDMYKINSVNKINYKMSLEIICELIND